MSKNLYDEELKKYLQNDNLNSTDTQAHTDASEQKTTQPAQTAKVSQPNAASATPASQPVQNVQPTQTSQPTVQQKSTPQYSSQWQTQLDSLMTQIMGREPFSYDMNGDAMYKQYEQIYTDNANKAMQNAMGQAAAMTGGYGSSYAQAVGQQAYADEMMGLNQVGLELQDRAWQRYLQEGDALNQQYSMLASREAQDYERYLNSVAQSNYENEMAYNQSRDEIADAQWQQSFDYQQAMDDRNQANWEKELAYQQAMDQQAQDNWNRQFASSEEQRLYENAYNEALLKYQQERDVAADDKWAQEFAAQQAQLAIDNAYRAGVLEYQKEQDKLAQDNWQASFDYQKTQDAQDQANWEASFGYQKEMDKQAQDNWQAEFDRAGEQWDALYGEGGINNPKFEGNFMYDADGNLREGYTTTNTNFFDENGNFKKATFSRTDENGNAVWLIDGKEVIRQPGANPYTGSVNPDAKNGTFSNGYQPNNIKGEKLSKTGFTDTINGIEQNVWKTPDGSMWIWDGTQNKYLPYEDIEEEKPKTTTSKSGGGGGGGKIATTTGLK